MLAHPRHHLIRRAAWRVDSYRGGLSLRCRGKVSGRRKSDIGSAELRPEGDGNRGSTPPDILRPAWWHSPRIVGSSFQNAARRHTHPSLSRSCIASHSRSTPRCVPRVYGVGTRQVGRRGIGRQSRWGFCEFMGEISPYFSFNRLEADVSGMAGLSALLSTGPEQRRMPARLGNGA